MLTGKVLEIALFPKMIATGPANPLTIGIVSFARFVEGMCQ